MATTSPVGIYYRTQAEARPTDEAMALSLANSVNNAVGLVPIVPTSVTLSSGTASTGTTGLVTFTNTSAVTLNGVFTSQYQKYLISYDALDSGADALLARLSTGGTANSSATYDEQFLSSVDTTVSASRNYNVARFSLNTTGASRKTTGQFTLTSPAEAVWTSFNANLMGRNNNTSSSTIYNVVIQGTFSATTQFDGFQIFPNGASTLTGYAQVYGYR